LLTLFLGLASAALSPGQIVEGRYIVELTAEPAVVAEPGPGAAKGARAAASTSRLAAVQTQQDRLRATLGARGVEVVDRVQLVANALIVRASEADAAALASTPGVLRVSPVILYKKLLDRSVVLQRITDAWALAGGPGSAGAGIRIAIIDTGIDATHPGFQDPDLQAPSGFPKVNRETDISTTNNKIIVARNYDPAPRSATDVEGHGTGVAMIAAGRTTVGPLGAITGVAPKAFLGNYKVFPDNEQAPNDAVLKAIDDAVADGMDIINLSLGSFPAQAPENDTLVRAIERASNAGIIVVVAAGNDGPGLNTISSPATSASAISVGNSSNDRVFSSVAQLEGGRPYIAVPGSASASSRSISAALVDVMGVDPSGLACGELPAGSLNGRVALILRGTCLFEEKLNIAQRAGAIAAIVYTHSEEPDPIRMDVGLARLPAAMISFSDGLDARGRLQSGTAQMTINFTPQPLLIDPFKLNASSSRGPSVDNAIKPDLLAVGGSIYTASNGTNNNPGFVVAGGTSFSAPMVAGAAAVLKAIRPGLTTAQYRSLLINSAQAFTLTSTRSEATIQEGGAGLLNVAAAARSTLSVTPTSIGWGIGSGTFDMTRRVRVTNLGGASDIFSLSAAAATPDHPVPSFSLNTIQLGPGESQEIELRFSGSGITPQQVAGVISVRSSSSDAAARIPYWYAIPAASPSRITIAVPVESTRPSGRRQILFRLLDSSGVAIEGNPSVTTVSGDGTVISTRSIGTLYPGVYRAEVQLGPVAGDNVFLIEAGGASLRVTVEGR
jgi:subtilisin family serine protease